MQINNNNNLAVQLTHKVREFLNDYYPHDEDSNDLSKEIIRSRVEYLIAQQLIEVLMIANSSGSRKEIKSQLILIADKLKANVNLMENHYE